ncbi:MAG: hypothetical protein JSW33_13315 [bacterium]|nr:MAG: hypothetical protein JSW33_13315 [bacterium]
MPAINKMNFNTLKRIPFLILLMILATTLLFQQCKKSTNEPQEIVYPDSNLSFIEHIQPIFQRDCANSGCHTSSSPASGLDLETLTPTFISENGPVVIAFNADQSRLYLVLLSDYMGIPRMPRGRAPLSINKITAIRTWINEGAIINK